MDQEVSKTMLESPLIISCDDDLYGLTTGNRKVEIMGELKKQMQLAVPLIVVSFLQYNFLLISIMFIGHLSQISLASASMATSIAGVTGFSFMLGMGSALETFCGQAYGAKQYHMLGVYMQRAMIVMSLSCLPVALLWANTDHILTTFNQDPEISYQAGIYARWLIPSILPYSILQCQFRFLQTQNNTSPLMISTGITSFIHVIVCWSLIILLGFGFKGAALSISISYWINVLILGIYIKFSPTCQKTWTGFSKEGRKDLLGFLKLGVPSALMVFLEFSSYEFLVLMSGFLPNPKLETSMMSISLSTSSLVFRIPFGFGSAVSTRVSNELGAGRPHLARLATQVVIVLAIIEGATLSLGAFAMRDVWGYLYTKDEEVAKYLAYIMPALAISNFMDGIQGVLSGVARGCGWQKIGAYVNLAAYYLFGLPCAIILTFFYNFGGKGLWIGITCGSFVQAIVLLTITIRTKWEEEAKKAKKRVTALHTCNCNSSSSSSSSSIP
ncbi:hypothetical protein ACFE04_027356 [Oxalis oulophora]